MPAYAAQPQLKFRNGKFRVLQLTDLHLMPNNPAKCAETEATVRDVVKHTNPRPCGSYGRRGDLRPGMDGLETDCRRNGESQGSF